jgi:hypothetical protein
MPATKINKSAFVSDFPASMSAQDVVEAAAAKSVKLTKRFVHTIRSPAKGGPCRPRKTGAAPTSGSTVGKGLVAEVERIVEANVNALLRARLGALLG